MRTVKHAMSIGINLQRVVAFRKAVLNEVFR